MSNIPADLKYTKSHEWIEILDDGTVRIGITDHAQDLLGDMVYIELPELGQELDANTECAVVESVKAASDVYAPISGVVTAINETLNGSPETLNNSPYEDGWLFCVKPSNESELDSLMDADAYKEEASDDH